MHGPKEGARIDDFKRNGLHTSAAQEILETLEGTLEVLQRQRNIIARIVEISAYQDGGGSTPT